MLRRVAGRFAPVVGAMRRQAVPLMAARPISMSPAAFGLPEDFAAAQEAVGPSINDLSNEDKLAFYSLYKQATVGDLPATKSAPSMLNLVENAKFEAWKALSGMPQDDAMRKYIAKANDVSGGAAPAGPRQWPEFAEKPDLMLPPGTFDGRVAFVTGGGTGLGRAMASYLSRLGATVVITSRKQAVLDETAAAIEAESGNRVLPIAADVRDIAAVEAALDKVVELTGQPADIVINNAAGNFVAPSERLSANAFGTIVDIVLKGTANVTLGAAKRLRDADRGGVFLSITTTYADNGSGYVMPSAAAKAGVSAMLRSLSSEWAKYGMRFVGIAPGPIETKGAFSRLDPTGRFKKMMINRLPTKRLGTPEELANVATFLMSPYASWITGEVLTFDGGEIRQMAGEFNALDAVSQAEWDQMEAVIRATNKK